jgi:hypothetical protein
LKSEKPFDVNYQHYSDLGLILKTVSDSSDLSSDPLSSGMEQQAANLKNVVTAYFNKS